MRPTDVVAEDLVQEEMTGRRGRIFAVSADGRAVMVRWLGSVGAAFTTVHPSLLTRVEVAG